MAAQLEAMSDLNSEGVAGLGILLVVGEETTHDGAIHASKCAEIVEPDVLIVGEPTENKLMKSQKGRLKADLSVYGEEGHSGYPEKFDSAVEKLFLFLDALWHAPWLKKHSAAGTTMNVTILEGGDADNKIPGFARARLVFRCADPCSVIKENAVQILKEVGESLIKEAAPHFELKWDPAENDSITNLCTLPDFEIATAAYNTDIAYFGWKSCRTFLLGPGSILQAHRDLKNESWLNGEWILKEEQIKGVELYKRLIHMILK